MLIAETLTTVIIGAAKMMASAAASEFAKGAGKSVYEAIKARLTGTHKAKSLDLLESAPETEAFQTALTAELAKPAIAADTELAPLVDKLAEALEAMPDESLAAAAIERTTLKAARDAILSDVEGIRDSVIEAGQDINLSGIKAPGKD
jgi:hypothetical protein